MNTYKTAHRPDPRIRKERVECAFDIFQQTQETGQGQIIFMTGDYGCGHKETLRAIDQRLGREVGRVQHRKRILGFTFKNRQLDPWRVFDRPAWMNLIGSLLPITQVADPSPFITAFSTLMATILVSSASAENMARERAARQQSEDQSSPDQIFNPTVLGDLLQRSSQESEYPLVCLIENFDQALDSSWYDWLLWHAPSLIQNHPLLLIVTLDQGPAHLPPPPDPGEDNDEDELAGLLRVAQYLCYASENRPASGQWWHLDKMTQEEVTQWMGKGDPLLSQQLHGMTGGDPLLVGELWQAWTRSYVHWTSADYNQAWAVETDETGYWWHIRPGLDLGQLPGAQHIVMQRLRQAWEAVDGDVESEELVNLMTLLAVAAQEGQTFSPPALAQVCNKDLDDLYDFFDEVFAIEEQPDSLLIQEPVTLIHDPERGGEVDLFCYTFRSEFVWHTLRHAYWSDDANLEADKARLHQLASTLDALYHPQQGQIAHTLIRLYEASGDKKRASYHQNVSDTIARKISLRSMAMMQLQLDRQLWDDTGWYLAMRLWFEAGYEMRDYFPHQETLTVYQAAYEAACHLQLCSSEGKGLHCIGYVYSDLGDNEKALGYYEEALPIRRAVGDRAGEAWTLHNMGSVYSDLGEKEKALGYYEEALPIRRAVGDRAGEAWTLHNIGSVYSDLGEKEKALGYYEEALPILRAVGDRTGEAATIGQIGHIYVSSGEREKALSHYQEALPILQAVEDRAGEATTLTSIGVIYSYQDDQEQALLYYGEALQLQRDVGHRQAEAITLHNMAKSYSSLGDQDQALRYYQEALQHQQATSLHWYQCITSAAISRVHLKEQEWAEAEKYARRAVEIAQAVKHPDLAEYEALLAEIEAGEVDDHGPDEEPRDDGQGGFLKRMWKRFSG